MSVCVCTYVNTYTYVHVWAQGNRWRIRSMHCFQPNQANQDAFRPSPQQRHERKCLVPHASTAKLCRMLFGHILRSKTKAESPLKIILPFPTAFKAPSLIGQFDFWNYSLQPCATAHAAFIVGTIAFRTADTGGWKLKQYFCWW